ncbi:hypothetical protein [Neobacillus sp. Marseille-QA0830]
MMRTWRVGTFSMGTLLVLLGLFLFMARFLGFNFLQVITAWWPVLLIVLGIEILVYLFLSRQESPVLRYDFLSIFFVGLIGTVGIGFAVLSSSGLLGQAEELFSREERSFELPEFSYPVDGAIKRVVVKTTGYDVTVEAAQEREVSMFGTYRIQTSKQTKLLKKAEEYVLATEKGDTLYVTVQSLPHKLGPFNSTQEVAATILVPSDVKLEVIGSGNQLTLKPRMLVNNWDIESASQVLIDTSETKDMKVEAVGVEDVKGKAGEWKVTETPDEPGQGTGEKSAVYQSGEGKYRINIANAFQVTLQSAQ